MSIHSIQSASSVRAAVLLPGLLAALLLSACGGGGGNPGTTGNVGTGGTGGTGGTTVTPAAPTVSLAMTNASGASTTSLTGATPLSVQATVLDAAKKPVPNTIVTFSTDPNLAVFSPTAGTALTDANGVATIQMRSASLAAGGAGAVTAAADVAGTTYKGTSNFSVGATTMTFGTLTASPSSIQAYGSTLLSVDLMAGSSKYVDQPVNVNFSSACVAAGKATLASTVPTNNGTAQTVYRDKGCNNPDTITVSADGVAKPITTTVAIAQAAPASVQFVTADPTDKSIVIAGQGGNGRVETATLTFMVVDVAGNPLGGKAVNFTTTSPYVKVNKASDITDASGRAQTTVNSGSTPTSFRVQATLPGTGVNGGADISTMSDSVVVTTGQPVQRAFSLSTETYNIEAWTHDSTPSDPATHLQVLVADAFGNPVPDGTPIVFQTNMGSVGSSDKGGCNTVNGGCSVDFRAQDPRKPSPNTPKTPCNSGTGTGVAADSTRVGLATICASTTDGFNTVFSRAGIFFSGADATNSTMVGSSTLLKQDPSTPNDLGSISASQTKVFQVQLNDVNLNPLPKGTKVEIQSMLNGNAAPVSPATVPNVAPHSGNTDDPTGRNVTGAQGSKHTFSISSTHPTDCTGPQTSTFNVVATTPLGISTTFPFKLLFTCP